MNLPPLSSQLRTVEILLIDDDPADVELTTHALKEGKLLNNLISLNDGVEALAYLRREGKFAAATRPDVILLDLNMPRKDGRQVLAELKDDPELCEIPVVVLTTSDSDTDILQSYKMKCNCYVTKPVDFRELHKVVQSIGDFWFTVVKLPPR